MTHRPDILLLEGLNVLQPAPPGAAVAVSDFIDFSVYVDAAPEDLRRWYVDRFRRLGETAFRDPHSFFRRYAALSEVEAVAQAERSGRRSTSRTSSRTSLRPRPGPPSCCARARTTA